ncbi:probable prefoldin subunit 2 [Tanacetum coccineum]
MEQAISLYLFVLFKGCHILCFVLKVDLTEGRYLISSASDASLVVYDIQCLAAPQMDSYNVLYAANKSLLKPVFQNLVTFYVLAWCRWDLLPATDDKVMESGLFDNNRSVHHVLDIDEIVVHVLDDDTFGQTMTLLVRRSCPSTVKVEIENYDSMIGGVLVERTIKEVLPALQENKEGIEVVIARLNEALERKKKELFDFETKYKIRIRKNEGESMDGNNKKEGSAQGVLVGPVNV